jgi:glycosyltransferase involved in cell wall biosynthesis
LRISVIIPTFNRREWIGECLDSVISQTYKNIEFLVVDDGSTDGTAEWIASRPEYSDVNVYVQENSGASVARNNGIEKAAGELIAFIDSDDALLPNHVETAVRAFENDAELGLFCCDSTMIDADGNVLFDGMTWHNALAAAKNLDIATGERSLASVFSYSNCFPGFTLRKKVFDELGGFDQSLFPADDYDLALRVAASRYKVFYLHEPLCLRREHDGQCSGIQNSMKTAEKIRAVLEMTISRNPLFAKQDRLIKRRFAELQFDIGISQMKEGKNASGAARVAGSILKDPHQIKAAVRIASRKIRTGFRTS